MAVLVLLREPMHAKGSRDAVLIAHLVRALRAAGHVVALSATTSAADLNERLRHHRTLVICNLLREPAALQSLENTSREVGSAVTWLNTPTATLSCLRERMLPLLLNAGIDTPKYWLNIRANTLDGLPFPIWLRAPTYDTDVRFLRFVGHARDLRTAECRIETATRFGIADLVGVADVSGVTHKYYGIGDHILPDPDTEVAGIMVAIRRAFSLDVFGVDIVTRPGGRRTVVDVNAWPSFSSVLPEALSLLTALCAALTGEWC